MRPTVALIGYGHIGRRHAEILEPDIVCDTSRVARAKAKKNGYKTTAFFDRAGADVVDICTPNYLHHRMIIDSLQNGSHVICEKPMTISEQSARMILEVLAESEGTLHIIRQNRYKQSILAVRAILPKLKVFQVSVQIPWNRERSYYKDWKGKKREDGGALWTQASHYIDVLTWFFGKAKRVEAIMQTSRYKIETEDTGNLIVQFDSVLVNFGYTTATFNKNYETEIAFYGLNGTVVLGGNCANDIRYWEVKGIDRPEIKQDPINDYGDYQGSNYLHHDNINGILRVIEGEESDLVCTPFEEYENIRIMQEAYDSAARQGL